MGFGGAGAEFAQNKGYGGGTGCGVKVEPIGFLIVKDGSVRMEKFKALGVPLKTERGGRVFPVSDNANDVADALAGAARRAGVRVEGERCRRILTENGAVSGVETDSGTIRCAAAVLCTGGMSYPLTGSTGDGYRFARELGHTIAPPMASLVPLESDDDWCAEMQGFALKNVTLSAYEDDRLIYRELGEMLFTHFGVSGPLVLSASAHMWSSLPPLSRLDALAVLLQGTPESADLRRSWMKPT